MTVRILLAGGTGMVGSRVTGLLSARPDVLLTSLVRTSRTPVEQPIDFETLVDNPTAIALPDRFDVGISCLGTTIRKAGTQSAFRRVDYDYVVAVARAASARGATQFILVSSVGAGGRGFYLQVKGQVEKAIAAIGFARLDLIRPGLLLGDRAERRPAERLAQRLAPLVNPLLVGNLRGYRSVPADVVAASIARLIGSSQPGIHVHESPRLGSGQDEPG